MPDEEKKQILKKDESKTGKQTKDKETATKDFDIWFPKIEFIDTIHKERIKIPVLSAGKEARIFQSLARLMETLPKTETLPKEEIEGDDVEAEDGAEAFSAADLLEMLPKLLQEAPKEAFTIASEILTSDKLPIDDKWVEDNLNFDKIFELIIPFVAGEAKLFEKVSGFLGKMSLSVNF